MNGYKDVRAAAERVLLQSGNKRMPSGLAIDVRRIAKEFCKFDVAEVPDLDLGGPALAAYFPEFDIVMVNFNCIETRKRFSIAHEIGHAQLEYEHGSAGTLLDTQKPSFFRCEDADIEGSRTEAERRPLSEVLANKFAAYLLMPESLIREAWRTYHDPRKCAEAMLVSRQAVTIRLNELRLT